MSYLNEFKSKVETFVAEQSEWQAIGLDQTATEFSLFNKSTKQAILVEAHEQTTELRFIYPSSSDATAKEIMALRHTDQLQTEIQDYQVKVSKSDGALALYSLNTEAKMTPINENMADFVEHSFLVLDTVLQKMHTVPAEETTQPATPPTPPLVSKKPVNEETDEKNATESTDALSPLSVIRDYFSQKGFRFKERTSDTGKKSFIFGIKTDHYRDKDDDASIIIVISLEEEGQLIRIDTPNVYNIYQGISVSNANQAFERYQKAANLIAHLQYEYKLIKYWLDPNDGELRMRFDLPLEETGLLDFSQINRQVQALVQIADAAHPKFEQYLFNDVENLFEENIFNSERVERQKKSLLDDLISDERIKDLSVAQLEAWQKLAMAAIQDIDTTDNTGI